ncbi:MAG: TIGR00730 family Rossman fold protein [Candidatus Limimorpha sp.]
MRKICVFCGSSSGFDKRFEEAAARLADVLADNDCVLYFGGGSIGLMNVIADRMLERGKKVIGVMPYFLLNHEIGHEGVDEMVSTTTMAERKEILLREADAFIVMPGGFGTLDEFSEAVVADQLRLMNKPVAIYNTLGYYDDLINWMRRGVKDGFIREEHVRNIVASDNPTELFERLSGYEPLEMEKWISDIKNERMNEC